MRGACRIEHELAAIADNVSYIHYHFGNGEEVTIRELAHLVVPSGRALARPRQDCITAQLLGTRGVSSSLHENLPQINMRLVPNCSGDLTEPSSLTVRVSKGGGASENGRNVPMPPTGKA